MFGALRFTIPIISPWLGKAFLASFRGMLSELYKLDIGGSVTWQCIWLDLRSVGYATNNQRSVFAGAVIEGPK